MLLIEDLCQLQEVPDKLGRKNVLQEIMIKLKKWILLNHNIDNLFFFFLYCVVIWVPTTFGGSWKDFLGISMIL